MQETEYRSWLSSQGKELSTQNTSSSMIRRLETAYGDLDAAFLVDGLEAIASDLAYSGIDRKNNEPNLSRLQIDGDVYNGLASARTHLNYYRRFLEDQSALRVQAIKETASAALAPVENEEPIEATLSLERDLNAALRQTITQLEPGMTVIDGGKERSVPSGRIDILAKDAQGCLVVIELKAVRAPRDAVAQVLAYMGDLASEGGTDVRGLLIAPDFDPRAVAAARMVPALRLMRFSFSFNFERVGPLPAPGTES